MHVEWEDEQVGKVKGIGVAPKFSLTPGKIVSGSVPIGHDNDRVYREMLGVSADDLESLRRDKVIYLATFAMNVSTDLPNDCSSG